MKQVKSNNISPPQQQQQNLYHSLPIHSSIQSPSRHETRRIVRVEVIGLVGRGGKLGGGRGAAVLHLPARRRRLLAQQVAVGAAGAPDQMVLIMAPEQIAKREGRLAHIVLLGAPPSPLQTTAVEVFIVVQ